MCECVCVFLRHEIELLKYLKFNVDRQTSQVPRKHTDEQEKKTGCHTDEIDSYKACELNSRNVCIPIIP